MEREQYLTYEYYKALGGSLDLASFNLLEFEARRKIDIRTQNRLKNSENIPREVKHCMFKLINSISSYSSENTSTKSGIASESTDGYSVSYVTSSQIEETIKSKSVELDDIIRTYLLGVVHNGEHLLYLGV